jgi:hypothetical protein
VRGRRCRGDDVALHRRTRDALVAALVAVTAVLFWFGPPVTADD